MSERAKKILKYVLSIGIAALFIWLVVRKIDWASFWDGLQRTRWSYIVMYFVVAILAIVFRAARWRQLLTPVAPHTRLIDTLDAVNVANLANIAMPGAGEFARCYYIGKDKAGIEKVFGTVVMERIWDISAIGVIIIAALFCKMDDFRPFLEDRMAGGVSSKLKLIWILLIVATVAALFIWYCYRHRSRSRFCERVASMCDGMVMGFTSFFKMKGKLLFLIYTVLIWLMYILMTYYCLKAVPELSGLNLIDSLFVSAVGNMATVIPVPSGVGPYHFLVMTSLSSVYGCTNEIGLLFAVLSHELHAVIVFILGAVSYARLSSSRKKS